MIGRTFDQLAVGDSSEFSKTISEADVYMYAGISGDLNPAHINETYAQGTFFKNRIAHGMLTASFISAVIGMQLPGPGTIYMARPSSSWRRCASATRLQPGSRSSRKSMIKSGSGWRRSAPIRAARS